MTEFTCTPQLPTLAWGYRKTSYALTPETRDRFPSEATCQPESRMRGGARTKHFNARKVKISDTPEGDKARLFAVVCLRIKRILLLRLAEKRERSPRGAAE
jgi:hypothetical protein